MAGTAGHPGTVRRGPRRAATLAFCLLAGGALGLGSFTLVYARGASYLTDDPAACANCHVMKSHYDAWVKSTHREVAVCNDCHAPHDWLGAKLRVKARNGFHHSLAFTSGRFPDPIMITGANLAVTESACRHCHQDVVHAIDPGPGAAPPARERSCTRCHADVGHMH